MDASILIITYNRRSILERVLGTLIPQMEKTDQLVVVDDGSTDDTEAMVRGMVPGVAYVKVPHNEGYRLSTRINQGLELAAHDMIWRLDSDCAPIEGSLAMLKEIFSKDRIIAGGIMYQEEDGRILAPDHAYRINFMQSMATLAPQEFQHWQHTGEVGYPILCFGGNICFSKEKALEIGGFDPDFDGAWGAEDSWFAEKMMRKLSVKLHFAPGVAVVHQWHPQNGSHRDEEARGRNVELWMRKSREMRS
jgi:glycosyltransferase involved in cell wall biosynthesis